MAQQDEFFEKAKFLTQHCWLNVDLMMTKEHFDQNIEFGKKLSTLPNIHVDYLPIQIDFGGNSEGLIDYSHAQLDFLQSRVVRYKDMEGRVAEKMAEFKLFGRGKKSAIRKINNEFVHQRLDYKDLIAKDENRFMGWECSAGIESLIVNMDGSVYRAYCYEGGSIGTIWDSIGIPIKSVICTKDRCKCSVDIEVSKQRVDLQ